MNRRIVLYLLLFTLLAFSLSDGALAIQTTPTKEEIQNHWNRVFSKCEKITKCTLEHSSAKNGEIVHRDRHVLALSGKKRMSSTSRYGGRMQNNPQGILRVFDGVVEAYAGAGEEFTEPQSNVSWQMSHLNTTGAMDYHIEGWYALTKYAGVAVTNFISLGYFDLTAKHIEVTDVSLIMEDGKTLFRLKFNNHFEDVKTNIYNARSIQKGTFWVDPDYDYLPVKAETVDKDGIVCTDYFQYQAFEGTYFLAESNSAVTYTPGSNLTFTTKVTLVTDQPVPDRMFELGTYGLIQPKRRSESWINSWSLILFGIVLVSGVLFYQWRNRS